MLVGRARSPERGGKRSLVPGIPLRRGRRGAPLAAARRFRLAAGRCRRAAGQSHPRHTRGDEGRERRFSPSRRGLGGRLQQGELRRAARVFPRQRTGRDDALSVPHRGAGLSARQDQRADRLRHVLDDSGTLPEGESLCRAQSHRQPRPRPRAHGARRRCERAENGDVPPVCSAGRAEHLLRRRGRHDRRHGPLQPRELPVGQGQRPAHGFCPESHRHVSGNAAAAARRVRNGVLRRERARLPPV